MFSLEKLINFRGAVKPSLLMAGAILTAYFAGPNADGYNTATFGFGFQILGSNTGNDTLYSSNTTQVPEPLTMLGSAAAIGFGAAFKGKLAKKQDKSLKS